MSDRALGAIVAAILAVPWTLIGFYLWKWPTPHGTTPGFRYTIYAVAGALTMVATAWGAPR